MFCLWKPRWLLHNTADRAETVFSHLKERMATGKVYKTKSRRRKLNLDWFKSLTDHYLYNKLPLTPTRHGTKSSGPCRQNGYFCQFLKLQLSEISYFVTLPMRHPPPPPPSHKLRQTLRPAWRKCMSESCKIEAKRWKISSKNDLAI